MIYLHRSARARILQIVCVLILVMPECIRAQHPEPSPFIPNDSNYRVVQVFGYVHDLYKRPRMHVPVSILRNGAMYFRTVTDSAGHFTFDEVPFERTYEYTLSCQEADVLLPLHKRDSAITIASYSITFSVLHKCHLGQDSNPYLLYAPGDFRHPYGISYLQLISLLNEYPLMVVEFVLFRCPEEKERIQRKRVRQIRKILRKNAIDPCRYSFSNDTRVIEANDETQESRAELRILNMDGCPVSAAEETE